MNKSELIKFMMEDYPEASSGNCLKCIRWDYDKMRFDFADEETGEMRHVTMASLRKGLNILLKIIEEGKYFNYGRVPNLLSEGYDHDGQDCDALVQCAIFGKIVYG